jgi:hypothetical protein
MAKANYKLNEQGFIVSLVDYPFDSSKPWVDDVGFIEGVSRVINGQIDNSLTSDRYFELERQRRIDRFRSHRSKLLEKYDILRINVINGDTDPATSKVYSAITQSEKQWRLEMLNFTDEITHETTEEDYPQTPQRISNL